MAKTPIEWAAGSNDGREGHSINPLRARHLETGRVGHFCVHASTGCLHCYSEKLQQRFGLLPFRTVNREKVDLFLDESKLQEVLRRKKPTGYFWCDMTDMFLDDHPFEWIDQCFATMALTPQHIHMVLTKRPERMREYFTAPDLYERILRVADQEIRPKRPELGSIGISNPATHPPKWIWLGVSVENQEYADKRIPELLRTPAAVRFISYEPALGGVNLTPYLLEQMSCDEAARNGFHRPPLDWVIVGGESGNGARPFNLRWARSVRDQCKAANVAFFMKQFGRNPYEAPEGVTPNTSGPDAAKCRLFELDIDKGHGGEMVEWPEDLRIRQFPEATAKGRSES